MIETAIRFALSNFTLTLLVIGLIASAIAYRAKPAPRTRADLVEALFSYFLLFSIGIANFYNFVMHVFFGEMTARFIGWADSPFQAEVGFRKPRLFAGRLPRLSRRSGCEDCGGRQPFHVSARRGQRPYLSNDDHA